MTLPKNYKRLLLIVDNDESRRQQLSQILLDDYDILPLSCVKEVAACLSSCQREVSAILSGLSLEHAADVYESLGVSHTSLRFSSIPVFYLTETDDEDTRLMALSHGAAAVLPRSYSSALIRLTLHNIFRLRETAFYCNRDERDALTHLYSKKAFFLRTAELLAHETENAFDILYLDVEDFKLVNDVLGESAADEILCFIATFLKNHIRNGYVCRMGGDIFAAVLPHCNSYSPLMARMCKSLAAYQPRLHIELKCGVYPITDRSHTVRTMCDSAKLACRSIIGKFGVTLAYYDQEFGNRLLREQKITACMKDALLNREFLIYYQPKCDLGSGKLIGAEALVRWKSSVLGFLPPNDFIPLFEKNGFISQLDFYVWETVCQDMRAWIDQGHSPIPISVNLSRVDIYDPALTHKIVDLLQKYRLPAQLIHLEITESAYTENPNQLIEVVAALKAHGFVIEMDDFGTGYSSLNMLNEVPVDTLKLDMRFLKNDTDQSSSGNILYFIMSLAKWMEISVVAEGVETRAQMLFLHSLGCNYGQGYYFSRPVPLTDFKNQLLHNSEKVTDTPAPTEAPAFHTIPVAELWNADSPFNHLFNGYVGALALFEYQNKRLIFVRLNEAFCSCCDNSRNFLGESLNNIFCTAQPKLYEDSIEKMVTSQGTMVQEFYNIPQKDTRIQMRLQVIGKNAQKTLVLASAQFFPIH